jgi:hypothetical protein
MVRRVGAVAAVRRSTVAIVFDLIGTVGANR